MIVPFQPRVLVGIDWATRAHEVCVLDGQRQILGRKSFLNNPTGLEALVGWLIELAGGDPAAVAVAIERPDGLVVEALLDRKIAVFTLNPKQLDRFRDRFSAAGAKDDRRDALVLADALRTDRHAFRRVTPDPDDTVALRGLVREDDALRIEETALSNRWRDYLGRYYPQLLGLTADRSDPLLWDLWELAPTPGEAAAVSRRRGRLAAPPSHPAARRRGRDGCPDRPGPVRGRRDRGGVHPSDPTLAAAVAIGTRSRRDCSRQIEALLKALEAPTGPKQDQHSDAAILRSLPGVGRVVLARMLTEAAEAIRHRDLSRLRALGGSAPVTERSGKTCHVLMRRACSGGLRFAYYHWARTATQNDERSAAHDRELRGRGKSHGRALRGVVDRLLSVAVSMLRAGTLYDVSLRPVREPGAGRRERPQVLAQVGVTS